MAIPPVARYFDLWLRQYTKLYSSSTPSTRNQSDVLALSTSYHTAISTFFSTSSPLELNVPSDIRRQLDGAIKAVAHTASASPWAENFLPPEAFAQVHRDSSESLGVSFKSFLLQASRNADRNRGMFAIILGAVTYLLGLIPTSEFWSA